MATMNAAVVTSFEEPPKYQPIEVPQPTTSEEILVDVLAVGLHPRVRTGAAGTHYTSTRALPMIPGIDAVARRPDGSESTSSPTTPTSGRWPSGPSSTSGARPSCPTMSMWPRLRPR